MSEAIFSLRLKRDGTVETVHVVNGTHTTAYGNAYQASSLRAILGCQPYDLPQDAYHEWRFFEPVFTEHVR
jgi:colicin import membrane protein